MDDDDARAIGARLAEAYKIIWATSMRDVPICNSALDIESIGFRAHSGSAVGIVVTPWFMNLVVAAPTEEADPSLQDGAASSLRLPAGEIECAGASLDGFGGLRACSLFSPMFDFAEMAVARTVAEEAMKAFFTKPSGDDSPRQPSGMGRRALLTGRFLPAEQVLP